MSRRCVAVVVAALAVAGCGGGGGDPEAPAIGGRETRDPDPARGARLVESQGCLDCHGPDAPDGWGAPFDGLAGTEVTLADGSTVVADTDHLRRSIADPDAQISAGYDVPMPDPGLSDDEIADIVAHLESR